MVPTTPFTGCSAALHRVVVPAGTRLPSLALVATLPVASASTHGTPTPRPHRTQVDLQAHRGGIGMTTQEQPAALAKALELGVTTLELDTQVTRDGKVVVTHDRQVQRTTCQDTAPVIVGDPMYPYVGKYVKDLSLAQVKTLDCGYQQLPGFPEQEVVWGAKMAELKDVFAVVRSHRAWGVTMNIETKVEAGAPEQSAPREVFVRAVRREIVRSGLERQVTIQSFDWGALMLMHRLEPRWPLVALTNHDFLQVGQPGASPWLGGIDAGVDGIITNYPDRVRDLMAARCMRLPKAYLAR